MWIISSELIIIVWVPGILQKKNHYCNQSLKIIKNISDIKLKNNNIESIMLKKMQGISDRSEETLSDKIDTSIRILSKRIGKREKKEDNNV